MSPRFLHCGLALSHPLEMRVTSFDVVMNVVSDDWIRYSHGNWILWTTKSADHVFSLIQPHLRDGEQALVIALDMTVRSGRMHPAAWEWMDLKARGINKPLRELLQPIPPPGGSS